MSATSPLVSLVGGLLSPRVALAALAPFVLGSLYYSPLCALPWWLREAARSGKQPPGKKGDGAGGHPAVAWGAAIAASFVAAGALNAQLAARGALAGAAEGARLGALLVAPCVAINYAFVENSVGLFVIDALFTTLHLAACGAVLRAGL